MITMSSDNSSREEWLGGCALATVVASVVSLPALTVIIVVLWLWERAVKVGQR
jgi:hypothetical protein